MNCKHRCNISNMYQHVRKGLQFYYNMSSSISIGGLLQMQAVHFVCASMWFVSVIVTFRNAIKDLRQPSGMFIIFNDH